MLTAALPGLGECCGTWALPMVPGAAENQGPFLAMMYPEVGTGSWQPEEPERAAETSTALLQ